SIVDVAASRGIPWIRLNRHSLVQLGYGINQRRIQATVASTTSSIAVEIACDKEDTKNLLEAQSIPVPKGNIVRDEEGLKDAIEGLVFPLATTPLSANHGRGATIDVRNSVQAVQALATAKKISRTVIVEEYLTGYDHRILVINYKFSCAAQ